jgi:hypothetical protein
MGFRETFSRMIFYNLDKLERVGSVKRLGDGR